MKCSHCGQEHPENFQFCPVTGQPISSMQACRNEDCRIFGQHILPPEAIYCRECGRPLNDVSGGTSTDVETEEDMLEFEVGGVLFNMIRVGGGTFTMGATIEQEGDAKIEEKPAHKVTLDRFYLGETQVTQALWEEVMGSNPSLRKGAILPVESVSWDECQRFISILNLRTDKQFRLPSEAEWEFAARGGNKGKYYYHKYSGSNNIDEVAWYDCNSGDKTHPVAMKKANELGLYDMSGNVCEWCQDWFGYYSSSAQTNPIGPRSGDPSTGNSRVARGGCYYDGVSRIRVSSRTWCGTRYHPYDVGLRLALCP